MKKFVSIFQHLYMLQSLVFASALYVHVLTLTEPSLLNTITQWYFLSIIFLLFFFIIIFGTLPDEPLPAFLAVAAPYLYLLLALGGRPFSEVVYETAFIVQATAFVSFGILVLRVLKEPLGYVAALPQLIFIIPAIAVSAVFLQHAFERADNPLLFGILIVVAIAINIAPTYKSLKEASILA